MQTILLCATVSAMFFTTYINKQIINSQSNNIKESEVVKRTSDSPQKNARVLPEFLLNTVILMNDE